MSFIYYQFQKMGTVTILSNGWLSYHIATLLFAVY